MPNLLRYFGKLTKARLILWCYAVWYIANVSLHFDPRPRLWLTSLGLSAIIGLALVLSTRTASNGTTKLEGWQIFRLFLMPFCVSSFAALVKDVGYILVFPPTLRENAIAGGSVLAFLLLCTALRVPAPPASANSQ
jgi:hypothetical protein